MIPCAEAASTVAISLVTEANISESLRVVIVLNHAKEKLSELEVVWVG